MGTFLWVSASCLSSPFSQPARCDPPGIGTGYRLELDNVGHENAAALYELQFFELLEDYFAPIGDPIDGISLVWKPDGRGHIRSGMRRQIPGPNTYCVTRLQQAQASREARDSAADHKDIHANA